MTKKNSKETYTKITVDIRDFQGETRKYSVETSHWDCNLDELDELWKNLLRACGFYGVEDYYSQDEHLSL